MIPIPDHFMSVRYNPANYPGAPSFSGLEKGANCQVFAYAFLNHHGLKLPPLRSSELWEDTTHTRKVSVYQPLDLILFGPNFDAFGAHVGVFVGEGIVLHLSAAHGMPLLESISLMQQLPRYRCVIGGKRVIESVIQSR
jgi:murein DD-endopeptidase / murein LD-carboxypeptidase